MNVTPKSSARDIEVKQRLEILAAKARGKLNAEVKKRRRLIGNLRGDLERHGDADRWKRYGDLILANLNSARREGDTILVHDYFDEEAPIVEIPGEHNRPLSDVAAAYFRNYAKARNGKKVIAERIGTAEAVIADALQTLERVDSAVENLDENYLLSLVQPKQQASLPRHTKKVEHAFKGARRFISSDGFEILVGKKAKDNDFLTFRIAKSLDLWLHAADYPGSHVIVRGSGKKKVPDRTLIEAAQLAAFYSDAREQTKAAVRYTEKKFVNKPRRSAPGLVSLASFKTILVEPKIGDASLANP